MGYWNDVGVEDEEEDKVEDEDEYEDISGTQKDAEENDENVDSSPVLAPDSAVVPGYTTGGSSASSAGTAPPRRSLLNLPPQRVLTSIDLRALSTRQLRNAEADSYLCLTRTLGPVQSNYTAGHDGVKRIVAALRKLLERTAPSLLSHFQKLGVELLHVVFRWLNCLFARELGLDLVIRLFDAYISELFRAPQRFDMFLVFFCGTFLGAWASTIINLDFEGTLMFLQKLPSQNWTASDVDALLARCHVDRELFAQDSALRSELERLLVRGELVEEEEPQPSSSPKQSRRASRKSNGSGPGPEFVI